jgi:hypothetical protein
MFKPIIAQHPATQQPKPKKEPKLKEAKPKKETKRKRERDLLAPKRPQSSYLLWCTRERKRDNTASVQELGITWKSMSPDAKLPFEQEAKVLSEQYKKEKAAYEASRKAQTGAAPPLLNTLEADEEAFAFDGSVPPKKRRGRKAEQETDALSPATLGGVLTLPNASSPLSPMVFPQRLPPWAVVGSRSLKDDLDELEIEIEIVHASDE